MCTPYGVRFGAISSATGFECKPVLTGYTLSPRHTHICVIVVIVQHLLGVKSVHWLSEAQHVPPSLAGEHWGP